MALLRFQALGQIPNHPIIDVKAPSDKVSDYFGEKAYLAQSPHYTYRKFYLICQ